MKTKSPTSAPGHCYAKRQKGLTGLLAVNAGPAKPVEYQRHPRTLLRQEPTMNHFA
jgi:hypothetical protein